MRALITGINGFVGHHLAAHLLEEGMEVQGTILPGETAYIAGVKQLWPMNLTDAGQVADTIRQSRPACIFHLAAQSSVALSWKDPALTMMVNLNGTIHLLEAVRQVDNTIKVLLAGSGEEYGPVDSSRLPISEEEAVNPGNPYALSKLSAGMIGRLYARAYDMNIYLARSFNHSGPGQGLGFVIPDFARQIVAIEKGLQEPVIRVGNLDAARDFSDVRDIVRAYRCMVEHARRGEFYNLGSGRPVVIRSILEQLISFSTGVISVEIDPGRFRPVDVPVIYADTSKIEADTGWKPEISLEQTLRDTLNYWRSTLN